MHFGRSVYFLTPSHGVLRVVSPADALMTGFIAAVFVIVMLFFYVFHARPRYYIGIGLLIAILLVGAASNGTITVDAVQKTAVVHTVFFGFPKTYTYPLSAVTGAYVGSADQTDALRLVLQGGAELQLTPFNQMRGKSEAAFAINQFLRDHGGTGYPN